MSRKHYALSLLFIVILLFSAFVDAVAMPAQGYATPMELSLSVGTSIASPCDQCSSIMWAARTSMPAARCAVGVATTADGKIYVIGGHISNSPTTLTTVERYDPSTDTWQTRASMPTPRGYLGVAVASNGKIYAMGGWNGSSFLATVEEYDPATDTWRACASMPTPRDGLGVAAASNGRLYAIGGRNSADIVATVEEYDPSTDTWRVRTNMPTARLHLGVVTASNGRIYAIGGWDATIAPVGQVEEYDPTQDTWGVRASMPTPRLLFGLAAASNGKLYAAGGSAGPRLATVEEYDPATDAWATCTSLPSKRDGVALAASNDKLYTFGGYGGHDDSTLFAEVLEASLPTDRIPPTTSIDIAGTAGANGWYVSDVALTVTSVDDPGGCGVKEIHYVLDGAPEVVLPGYIAVVSLTEDGSHTLIVWAVDNAGNVEAPPIQLSVKIDKTPPILAVTVCEAILWPPNHQYRAIRPVTFASDNLTQGLMIFLVSVQSNEPDDELGDGDKPNDIVVNPDGTISLRAERSGTGSGRVYTITYQAVDEAGNAATATALVVVPHDNGSKR